MGCLRLVHLGFLLQCDHVHWEDLAVALDLIHFPTAAGIGFDSRSALRFHVPVERKDNPSIMREVHVVARLTMASALAQRDICLPEKLANFETVLTFAKTGKCWCDFVTPRRDSPDSTVAISGTTLEAKQLPLHHCPHPAWFSLRMTELFQW